MFPGMSLLTLLVVLLVVSVLVGGWGHTRDWGVYGWSPLGIVLVVLVVLWLTGSLHGGHGIRLGR
jgi:hypothetical protein